MSDLHVQASKQQNLVVFGIAAMGMLACPISAARGEEIPLTQVGTVNGRIGALDMPSGVDTQDFEYVCPDVKFPREFGEPPKVIVSEMGCGGRIVKAEKITTKGFKVLINDDHTKKVDTLHVRYETPFSVSWTAVGSVLLKGTAQAKYLVLTIVYAPPGTNGGHSTSSVSYSAGSTLGVTTSASRSFQTANSVSVEASGGFLGNGGGGGLSFETSHSRTDSQSLEIKKSTSSTITRTGPGQDGINHDSDAIYLLLNPSIDLALSPSSAQWMLANTQSPIQYVYVGWLNGHVPMPENIATALKNAGISAAEYADILARDPLAVNESALDSPRYQALNTTFPYEPPLNRGDLVPTFNTNISSGTTQTTGTATEDSYRVGLTHSNSGNYLGFVQATLKESASWTWTNRSSQLDSKGSSESASVTIGGPSFEYTGPTVMKVYIDTIYHTFAFGLVPVNAMKPDVNGILMDKDGQPMPGAEVVVHDKQTKYRTFTNATGEYKFFDLEPSKTIEAAGVVQELPANDARKALTIKAK